MLRKNAQVKRKLSRLIRELLDSIQPITEIFQVAINFIFGALKY